MIAGFNIQKRVHLRPPGELDAAGIDVKIAAKIIIGTANGRDIAGQDDLRRLAVLLKTEIGARFNTGQAVAVPDVSRPMGLEIERRAPPERLRLFGGLR